MPSRFVVAPALAASLVALAGQAVAGDNPPVFHWLQPVSNPWGTAGAWDQSAVPGRGEFVGADVFLNAAGNPFNVILGQIGDTAPIDVGALVLGEQASLTVGLSASHQSSARSISLTDQSRLLTAATFQVHESVDIGTDAVFETAAGELLAGGALHNNGLVIVNGGKIVADSVFNYGRIESRLVTGSLSHDLTVSDRFVNEGELVMTFTGMRVLGDMTNRGSVEIGESSGFSLKGNLHLEQGSTFVGAGSITIDGEPGVHRRVTGDLEHAGSLHFRGGGNWSLEGAVTVGTITTLKSNPLDSFGFSGHLQAGSISLAANSTATFQSVMASGSAQISATTVVFNGEASFGGATSLSAQQLSFGGLYSFADDLAINAATVHFENGLDVGGDLSVTANARITIGDGTKIVIGGGDITWTTPSVDLDHALTASNQIVVGVPRINATLTAARMRITAGITELNADLVVTDNVSIAGTSLSIGAANEIAHRTIYGDLTTTFSQSQAWDFDIVGSAARGIADSDTLAIEGDATIYGVLRVNAFGGSDSLRAGDEFTLFTAGSIDASFRLLSLPSLSEGLSFDLVYEPSAVRLVVVPSPGAGLALGLAGLPSLVRRRRDRSNPRSRTPLAKS